MAGEPILVTGAAGFIGFALREGSSRMAARLLASTMSIPDYDPAEARLAVHRQFTNFTFHRLDLADRKLEQYLG